MTSKGCYQYITVFIKKIKFRHVLGGVEYKPELPSPKLRTF